MDRLRPQLNGQRAKVARRLYGRCAHQLDLEGRQVFDPAIGAAGINEAHHAGNGDALPAIFERADSLKGHRRRAGQVGGAQNVANVGQGLRVNNGGAY